MNPWEHRTSNIQHRTPNRQSMAQLETIGCSMLDVGCWMFSFGSWVQCANFSGNSFHDPEDAWLDSEAVTYFRFMASIRVQILEVLPPHELQGRARHSVRAVSALPKPRRARSDAPYLHKLVQGFDARNSSGKSL